MQAAIATTRDRSVVLAAFANAGITLPKDLRLVSSRLGCGDHLCAAGFVDAGDSSVAVDIALWTTPPAPSGDTSVWRAVFDWIVAPDDAIRRARVDGSITIRSSGASACYVYEHEGRAGRGVLSIIAREDGAWQIIDCWGDASDDAHIQELSHACRTPD
jgi:hypothetical protein